MYMKKREVANSTDKIIFVTISFLMLLFVASASYVLYRDKDVLSSQTHTATADIVDSEQSIVATTNKKINKDSDNDGLSDWEEELWNTDPNNPDSDGDGVNDSEEVKNNKDPNISGSGKLAFEINDDYFNDEPETKTEIVSKEIFESFVSSIQNNEEFTTEKKNLIAKNALNAAKYLDTKDYTAYTKKDVNIVTTNFNNKKKYAEKIISELHLMVNGDVVNEYESLFELAQGDKQKAVENLNKTSKFYKSHIEILKNINVPSDAVNVHIEFIQSLLKYTNTLNDLGNMFNDPLRSADAISMFKSDSNKLTISLKKIHKYIDDFVRSVQKRKTS